jgi:Family of unknown function (DUF6758)
MRHSVCCPRCGGAVRPPDLMTAQWRCATCGSVAPLWVAPRVSPEVLASVCERIRRSAGGADEAVPLWCPWPLPPGWLVTGVGWTGDARRAPRATALAVSGPAPFSSGPSDLVLVAEDLGVGLGGGLAGLGSVDAGPSLYDAVARTPPDAKIRTDGHPTPLWSVPSGPDRSVHVGEARAIWLYVIAWPPEAAYLLVDGLRLRDLVQARPGELLYGADSSRLRPVRGPPPTPPTAHLAAERGGP